MGWEFPVLLVAAFVLVGLLSYRQVTRYQADVNATARAHAGPGRYLVSGRGKGRLYGAVAVLVVDAPHGEVRHARTMSGVSVFARLKPAPELEGPLATVAERAESAALRRAIEDALTRLPAARRRADHAARTVISRPGRHTTQKEKGQG